MTISKSSIDELSISKERLAEISAIPDDDIDTSDIPELDEAFSAKAQIKSPAAKKV